MAKKRTRQHQRIARCLWQSALVEGIPDEARLKEAIVAAVAYGRDAEPVLRCLMQRIRIYLRERQIRVVSAGPVSLAQQQLIKEGVCSEEYPDVEFLVNPSLLGGMRIERGFEVSDRTVSRQLETLQRTLVK